MAEDEDGVSNKNSSTISNNDGLPDVNDQNNVRPDLGIEEVRYNNSDNGQSEAAEAKSSSSKGSGARKEDNPFSFRHFLKRDLSLPSNSTYENTGARPKVYASTTQHSPNRTDFQAEPKRDKARATESQTKEKNREPTNHFSDVTASSSSLEIPVSVVEDTESKHNLFIDNSESTFYHRPNLASEPLGMPSLPDFVQDHILVEQAYLSSNGPVSVDIDNLPDFTFNTNFNAGSTSSLGRRNNSNYNGSRSYDYDPYLGQPSTSDSRPSGRSVPLDLPVGNVAAAAPMPLDLPPHLNLDLTESVNPADRRNNSPRDTCPLDLPSNAESMRLPDFLPVHPGRTSPEPEDQDEQMQQIMAELARTRSELFAERSRRSRVEGELESMRSYNEQLRADLAAARAQPHETEQTEAETNITKLRNQIKKLKADLAAAQAEARRLRERQGLAATDLRHATGVAETSLRELLSGLEQLKSLSFTLDPT